MGLKPPTREDVPHIFFVFAKDDFQACMQLLSQKYNYEQVIDGMQSPEIQMRLSQPYFVQQRKHDICSY